MREEAHALTQRPAAAHSDTRDWLAETWRRLQRQWCQPLACWRQPCHWRQERQDWLRRALPRRVRWLAVLLSPWVLKEIHWCCH